MTLTSTINFERSAKEQPLFFLRHWFDAAEVREGTPGPVVNALHVFNKSGQNSDI